MGEARGHCVRARVSSYEGIRIGARVFSYKGVMVRAIEYCVRWRARVYIFIKELGLEPEDLVSEPESMTGIMGWNQRIWR